MTSSSSPSFSQRPEAPYPAPLVAWYGTIVLAVLYWFSILDRFIIALLVDPIKQDIGITDVQFSLLHGFAFVFTYALFGLVAGSLADRFSRRLLIFVSVSVWSVATAACGLAQQFWHLLMARVGVGAGEAGLNPCATSMLTDLFPRHRLTSAMAVYTIGATVGSGTAYLVGGVIVDLVSDAEQIILPLVGEIRAWQAVFFIVGAPGLLLSLLIFTLPEPVRRNRHQQVVKGSFWGGIFESYRVLLKFIREKWRFFLPHYVGFALASTVVGGGGTWFPAHMSRTFGWSATQIGLTLGITLLVGGICGKLLCGHFVDRMYQRGYRDAQLRWYSISLLLATPIGLAGMVSGNPWIFLGCIGVFIALAAPLPAVANTALNLVTPNELRGAGVAFFGATAGMIGIGGGPLLIALLSDHLFGSTIGLGLAGAIVICFPLAAGILWLGCKPMRDAVTAAERDL